MQSFLFRFGYSTPDQWVSNQKHGWDDECSGAFFVYAETPLIALSWGREVAESYVRSQFEKAGWTKIPSWKEGQFANWIEENPAAKFSTTDLEKLPRVNEKEIPDFEGWP